MTWFDKSRIGCFLEDHNGRLSHARLIAVLVGFSATFFMWKLTVMGELNESYFLYYLSYGVIHMNVSKFLDVMNSWLNRGSHEAAGQAPKPDLAE